MESKLCVRKPANMAFVSKSLRKRGCGFCAEMRCLGDTGCLVVPSELSRDLTGPRILAPEGFAAQKAASALRAKVFLRQLPPVEAETLASRRSTY